MTNIERFESLLQSVKREGIEDLLKFIRKSDFYTAPASTRFHLCVEGGLLQHSLNVYDMLAQKKTNEGVWREYLKDISDESIILVSLLHDLCKTNFYKQEMRNKKDNNGQWVQVPFYTVEDKAPMGHGCKSVIMLQSYIKLKKEEIYAILHHMGFSVAKEDYNSVGATFDMYPLALAVHMADLEASHLLEVVR